ncbi:MAG: homocysteine S-methyltransferase family protein [Gammaproteobacteria bacterium]|nr:homocysteine S-methyltransferase family protein [Gammaproteobacteria bacterium]
MGKYRTRLPQTDGQLFLTDGGLETTLIFDDGIELPDFAAFDLFREGKGTRALHEYYRRYASIARDNAVGLILESATWRASSDWALRLGYTARGLADANRASIQMLERVRDEFESERAPMVISGCIGPRGDGYSVSTKMTVSEASRYHAIQANTFQATEADLITGITMTHVEEAIGVVRAAQAVCMPVVISFTTEIDGRLPSGQALRDAIEQVDSVTDSAPVYYMVNCAHPTHFEDALDPGSAWTGRIRGIRANASTKSHAALDEATELDSGDPLALGEQYRVLLERHNQLNVVGGCCGTDYRHVEAIYRACTAEADLLRCANLR